VGLVAADIDRTLLEQRPGEHWEFFLKMGNPLVQAAELDFAVITGNSMEQMTRRFLTPLVQTMCRTGKVDRLSHMHFFCNSSGVYAHFPTQHGSLARFAAAQERHRHGSEVDSRKVLARMLDGDAIRPEFLNEAFLNETYIPPDHLDSIERILEKYAEEYFNDIEAQRAVLSTDYNLDELCDSKRPSRIAKPKVERREMLGPALIGHPSKRRTAAKFSVQITLKPVLSFRHARTPAPKPGRDKRTEVIRKIQQALDEGGLDAYLARPGGHSSIDVTRRALDKSFGLAWLIERLGVAGVQHRGEAYGANTVYLGDEVIAGGGNDYAITKIPGVLVFAVNEDRSLVPFLNGVVIPFADAHGPAASARLLQELNGVLELADQTGDLQVVKTFREQFFRKRLRAGFEVLLQRPENIDPMVLQALHAFLRLASQNAPNTRRWTQTLASLLDLLSSEANALE
jgi:hypothetical protein